MNLHEILGSSVICEVLYQSTWLIAFIVVRNLVKETNANHARLIRLLEDALTVVTGREAK